MKRIATLSLASLMLIAALAGCSGQKPQESDAPAKTPEAYTEALSLIHIFSSGSFSPSHSPTATRWRGCTPFWSVENPASKISVDGPAHHLHSSGGNYP